MTLRERLQAIAAYWAPEEQAPRSATLERWQQRPDEDIEYTVDVGIPLCAYSWMVDVYTDWGRAFMARQPGAEASFAARQQALWERCNAGPNAQLNGRMQRHPQMPRQQGGILGAGLSWIGESNAH
jgi:hypothetical protein